MVSWYLNVSWPTYYWTLSADGTFCIDIQLQMNFKEKVDAANTSPVYRSALSVRSRPALVVVTYRYADGPVRSNLPVMLRLLSVPEGILVYSSFQSVRAVPNKTLAAVHPSVRMVLRTGRNSTCPLTAGLNRVVCWSWFHFVRTSFLGDKGWHRWMHRTVIAVEEASSESCF